MYAIVEIAGGQYRVEEGSVIRTQLLHKNAGEAVTFDRILLVGQGEQSKVGTPYVSGASVSATVQGEGRGEKLQVFWYKAKSNHKRKMGHRQGYTELKVTRISG